MIDLGANILLPDESVEIRFLRASGPGGQNVNKVSTAVELRFHLGRWQAPTPTILTRIRKLAGRRLSSENILVIEAQEHRSQARNKAAALARLADILKAAFIEPKARRASKPTAGSRERRLSEKKQRAKHKVTRRAPEQNRD